MGGLSGVGSRLPFEELSGTKDRFKDDGGSIQRGVTLAGRCGDRLIVEACARALSQRGDIVERVDVIGQVLDAALV